MSKKLYPETDIQNIANAIRALNGSTDTYTVSEMASAIALPENGYYLKESAKSNPLTITDGEELNAQSCEVEFSPIQDLHGYDSPWIDSNEINSDPYLFRAVRGTATRIGNSLFDTLVGGTVAFNQLVQNGNFADTSEWYSIATSFSVSNNVAQAEFKTDFRYVRQEIQTIVGHKYLSFADIRVVEGTMSINIGKEFTITNSNFERFSTIFEADSTSKYFMPLRRGSSSVNVIGECKNCMLIDLTQMFGSTIADYIYSLEQTTAGRGVAYFRNLFPKDYYAYNAGQLMSVKALSHKMVGFNQFDISNAELVQTSASIVDTNGFTKVLPNTTYYIKNLSVTGEYIYQYDASKNNLNLNIEKYNSSGFTFTTSKNTHFIKLRWYNSGGVSVSTVENADICINLHWDGERDGEYEAYSEHIYPLDSDLELRGIPKLDANNNLYYDGDTYESDGTVTRKYGTYTFTGNESWTWYSDNEFWYTNLNLNPTAKSVGSGMNTKNLYMTFANGIYVRIYSRSNTGIDSTTNMNTILVNGDKLLYELDTPFTETADTFENPQLVDNWGTEEYTDSRDVQIPVGHETYQANICEISGHNNISVTINGTAKTTNFSSTVYGGNADIVNGGGQNEWGYIASYNGETLPDIWISDRDAYEEGTTPTTGAEVVYKLATATDIIFTGTAIPIEDGNNTFSTDGDSVQVKYFSKSL